METPLKTGTLKVPGATLYFESVGAGPLLLLIPGGPQDAGVFVDLARQLGDRYTVVAYDPRGNSRSTLDAEPHEQVLAEHGEDAAALIRALGGGPAYVFGTSGGAQIGLELTARHPELVRTLVAHEPPTMMLLPDPSAQVAAARGLHDTYREKGVDAAMATFFADNGLADAGADGAEAAAPPEQAPAPEAAETFARVSGNFEHWLAHGVLPLSFYRPDVAALRAGKPRVLVGIGQDSAGQPIEQMALALAEKLAVEPVSFPGDHAGFEQHAATFASTLHRALAAA